MATTGILFLKFIFLLTLYAFVVDGACNAGEWRCANGDCIEQEALCDGTYHCNDQSDESKENCLRTYCPRYAFRCSYGACIRKSAECDGNKDCVDNSDELQCTKEELPQTNCSGDEDNNFQCDSGHCISEYNVCDGEAHCSDKSDETLKRCLKTTCPSYSYRCAYGACISKRAVCNGIHDCIDGSDEVGCDTPRPPIQPTSGSVSPGKNCALPSSNGLFAKDTETNEIIRFGGFLKSGSSYDYQCPKNHILLGALKDICNGGELLSASNRITPTCSRYCNHQILRKVTTQAVCKYKKNTINCNDYILPGTTADIRCQYGYEEPVTQVHSITCLESGDWDNQPYPCIPTCGSTPLAQKPFIYGGYTTTITNIPWQAAIYKRNAVGRYTHICGGSIVTAKLVVTAAHCLWDRQRHEAMHKSLFTVGVGKTRRDYYIEDADYTPQFSNISEFHIPLYFAADDLSYVADIAVLVLNNAIIFKNFIVPICWERQSTVNKEIESNVIGKIAGWGKDETGEASEFLKFIDLESISKKDCKTRVPNYETSITADKFCVKSDDLNNSICDGDSGGGFAVKKMNNKYYLEGVVSTGLKPPEQACGGDSYTTFTNVRHHIELIGDLEKANRVY
ncbi:hypothetical protein ACFFRR_003545 [Megaselia abdita]